MEIINNTPEWVKFKENVITVLRTLEKEGDNFEFSEEPNRFDLHVNGCLVYPLFAKKENHIKVEYDFTLCDTSVKMLTFYQYTNKNFRIDISMK